ncbi:hypothetical protein FHR33_001753 [Nonomuraea dietziae]|uniref:Uncharacterized protein n=1 Tax=Nonomuraea dietziae TaxID=65515 RepID=A0A7W5V495_9ACTN|nr:hypothetical protein [Nonomuraea dietziae]
MAVDADGDQQGAGHVDPRSRATRSRPDASHCGGT